MRNRRTACNTVIAPGSRWPGLFIMYMLCMQALYHAVPTVFIPLFFEQPWNADQVEFLGAGLNANCKYPIERHDLSAKLTAALVRVAESDSMQPAAQRISQLMRAQRWSAAEQAASMSCPHVWAYSLDVVSVHLSRLLARYSLMQ